MVGCIFNNIYTIYIIYRPNTSLCRKCVSEKRSNDSFEKVCLLFIIKFLKIQFSK
jgi:hypothetical protein